jgi:hypothetical protein
VKSAFKKISVSACIVACLAMVGLPVFAAEPHEDPETARTVFSGMSIFQFYSGTLDFVLIKSQQDIEINIQKAPFANIPPALEDSLNNFVSSAKNLCSLILDLDASVSDIKVLLHESRYQEAAPLISKAFENILLAEGELDVIERATKIAGTEFQLSLAPKGSGILEAYKAVLDRIQRFRDLLKLYRSMVGEQQTEISNRKPLLPTELTLKIKPVEAFVGDTIGVEGTLYTNGKPLADREIDIILNGSRYLTVKTDSQGRYSRALQVPYWYIPVIQVQSLYYPRASDVGIYGSCLSPSASLKVLFYDAILMLQTDKNAYPGRTTSIGGQFDYDSSPSANKRGIEIYLDNTLVRGSEVTNEFTEKLSLSADMKIGKHLITVSVSASGRYAPLATNATLNVKKATPVLTINLPSVALVPGSFVVNGKLDSEIGPVERAHITMIFEGKKIDAVSGDDGTFSATIKNNMGFGLFGSQSLEFMAIPQEPWQATLTTLHKIMTVYIVNCGAFFFILVILGVILPRRIKFRPWTGLKKKPKELTTSQPELLPVPSVSATSNIAPNHDNQDISEPHSRLFYWYRIVIQLIQRASGVLFKPNQTLREFVRDASRATGSSSKFILEFTRIIEKVLYSPYKVTEDDAKSGAQLAQKVQESLKK